MVELVAEHGYVGVTVRGLSRRAGVSSGTLYDHFVGKEDCFFATYDLLMAGLAGRIIAACNGERDRRRRLRLVFSTLMHQIVEEPQAARLCFVEALAVGPSALERTRPAAELFAAVIKDCFDASDETAVPALLVKGIVAGLAGVARARLLSGREGELPALVEGLVEWALCFGSPETIEFAGAPGRPTRAETRLRAGDMASWQGEQAPGADRALIISAAARLAANEGYGELSIPRIRTAAGVSRKSFDAHFDNIDDCFLAALEVRAKRALGEAARGAGSRSWEDGVRHTISALCAHIARDPVRARAVFVEIFAPGTEGVRHRAKLIDDVAVFLRGSAPSRQRPTRLAAEASAAAVWGVLEYHVASGRTRRLPSMAATLATLVVAPSMGVAEAVANERMKVAKGNGKPMPPVGLRRLAGG